MTRLLLILAAIVGLFQLPTNAAPISVSMDFIGDLHLKNPVTATQIKGDITRLDVWDTGHITSGTHRAALMKEFWTQIWTDANGGHYLDAATHPELDWFGASVDIVRNPVPSPEATYYWFEDPLLKEIQIYSDFPGLKNTTRVELWSKTPAPWDGTTAYGLVWHTASATYPHSYWHPISQAHAFSAPEPGSLLAAVPLGVLFMRRRAMRR
jgi:hypothetical protein